MRLARRGGQALRIAHRLEKERDHLRRFIAHQQLEELADPEIGLVAHRDELGVAQPARRATREERAEHGATLRDEARRPRRRRLHFQHTVHRQREATRQVDHAHAVRSEKPHAERTRARHEPLLALGAGRSGVGKAVGIDAHDGDAFARAVLKGALHVLDHDERVIDLAGRIRKAPIGPLAEHFVARCIDRHDAARVAVLAQIALRPRGVLARIAGGADQRHGARREERLR